MIHQVSSNDKRGFLIFSRIFDLFSRRVPGIWRPVSPCRRQNAAEPEVPWSIRKPPVLREINRGDWMVRHSQGLFPFFENLRGQGENSVGIVPANNETGGNSERAIYGGVSLLCGNRKRLRLGDAGDTGISVLHDRLSEKSEGDVLSCSV